MADNIISQYYTKNDGTQISNDYQFSTLQDNEKIIHKNNGEKFVKNPSYSNVFDKANAFTDLNSEIKSSTVSKINNANSNGDVEYYAGTTKLGSFNVGIKQSDLTNGLNDVRSTSIANIDDATASGVCSCKNSSGTQIDTFTCHVPVNNSAPTLSWGQTSTIGTVDGTSLTVKMPANPDIDTKYSAGTGLTLSGTTFNVNIPNYKMSDGSNPDTTYIMTLDANQNACHPSGYTVESLVKMIQSTASSSFFIRTIQSRAAEGGEAGESFTQYIEKLYIPEKEKYLYTVSGLAKNGRRVPIPGNNIEILSFSGTYYVGNGDINADGSGHLDIGAVDESVNIRTGNLNKATGTWVSFFCHNLYDGPNGAGLSYNLKYLAT